MALKLSKRKRPLREEKPLKERIKISSKVLDEPTLMVLVHFINTGLIKSVDYPVSSGKESVVFRATGSKDYLAVKVFRYETSVFQKKMHEYIEGDPRFLGEKTTLRNQVHLWARKEFANLRLCHSGGVLVPAPLALKKNVLVMEFLGQKGIPSALLKDVVLENPSSFLDSILFNMKRMHSIGLVHGDLSPFNIVVHSGKPYFIDLGQAVLLEHPKSSFFLERDLRNVLDYFRKEFGVEKDFSLELRKLTESLKKN